MAKEQKGFIVYGDIEPVVNRLSDEEAGKLLKGMVKYFNTGTEPDFSGILEFVFIPIKQQMDRDADKYVKRCEKMRENVNKRWSKDTKVYNGIQTYTNDTNTNTKTNTNTNTDTKTDTDTDTNTMSSETDVSSLSLSLIGYLNEKAGTNYRVTKSVTKQITALVENGMTFDQMRTVVDKKCAEWMNDEKMRTYLRPSTLFGDRFEEYLAAPISLALEKERREANKKESLIEELAEKKQTLAVLRSSLDEIPRGTRMDERRSLKDQIAQLEDSIGLIEGRLS